MTYRLDRDGTPHTDSAERAGDRCAEALTEADVWPGRPYPMGANWDGQGTNFAVFSSVADAGGVQLCLFGEDGRERRFSLTERTGDIWHGYLRGIGPGQRYGFRVAGPHDPSRGLRCNPAKLLLDPYALAIDGTTDTDSVLLGAMANAPENADPGDSAGHAPRSVVVDPAFDWGDDRPPRTPCADTVIYELHVKGFTQQHPAVPAESRGTFAGLASESALDHLTRLGVTAVELLPVQHFISEQDLLRQGLSNYWGYQTIGYFAPHAAYAASGTRGQQVAEFKAMVKALHAAGLEVILDVAYNHTGEGNENGPTVCFRGFDNPAYYRLDRQDLARYVNLTGTGNSLNVGHPEVLRLILSSLRYWVTEMHVDGFRFDLAAELARQFDAVDRLSAFFDLVYQDPIVSQVKLIAEPWDLGRDGYQVGHFPSYWCEWNDHFRDGVRDFWRGASFGLGDLASRLSGSSDLFEHEGRAPHASINYVTAHDGFALADLVSYNVKHNEANRMDGGGGADDNHSWNCGEEGLTASETVLALRNRQRRNLMASLLLAQGVPMILGGDELGRTQHGNNNAYCQDNELSWFDWTRGADDADFLRFTQRCVALRRQHPVFRQRSFLHGQPVGGPLNDVDWFNPAGTVMTSADWAAPGPRVLSMFLNGDGIEEPDECGCRLRDDSFLLLVNGQPEVSVVQLPGEPWATSWEVVLDTDAPTGQPDTTLAALTGGGTVTVPGRTLRVLRRLD